MPSCERAGTFRRRSCIHKHDGTIARDAAAHRLRRIKATVRARLKAITTRLAVLRSFIDFVNRQVGVYCDCLAGFQGNKVRVERQMPRLQRPTSHKIEDGQPVITYVSVEDPSGPDVLHHRIIRADEFINVNSEAAYNEQQICWAIVVFIFTYWDAEIRPQIARIRGVAPNEVKLDEMVTFASCEM